MTTPSITPLSIAPGTALCDAGIVSAVEIVHGRAVIVVLEHASGAIGIGNVVRGERHSPESARNRCLRHALDRVASYTADRQRQAMESAQ